MNFAKRYCNTKDFRYNKHMKNQYLKRAIYFYGILALVGLGSLAYIWIHDLLKIQGGCFLSRHYGIFCPGCGGSRMVFALLKGNFYRALRWNPFLFCSIPYFLTLITVPAYYFIRYNKTPKWIYVSFIIYGILLLLFGIIRNLPGMEFLQPIG